MNIILSKSVLYHTLVHIALANGQLTPGLGWLGTVRPRKMSLKEVVLLT